MTQYISMSTKLFLIFHADLRSQISFHSHFLLVSVPVPSSLPSCAHSSPTTISVKPPPSTLSHLVAPNLSHNYQGYATYISPYFKFMQGQIGAHISVQAKRNSPAKVPRSIKFLYAKIFFLHCNAAYLVFYPCGYSHSS